jgi:hypothetical protein
MVETAAQEGIRCALFEEPDDNLGLTASCSEPICGMARRIFRCLPLWRVPSVVVRARGLATCA